MKLKRTLKSFVIISFFFILLIGNVSFAHIITADETLNSVSSGYNFLSKFGPYTVSEIYTKCQNYYNDPSNADYRLDFENMQIVFSEYGYSNYFLGKRSSDAFIFSFYSDNVDIAINNNEFISIFDPNEYIYYFYGSSQFMKYIFSSLGCYTSLPFDLTKPFITNSNIKELSYVTDVGYSWDGNSYFYQVSSADPEEPEELINLNDSVTNQVVALLIGFFVIVCLLDVLSNLKNVAV